ncbi:MAG: ComEA family DNA-binding protein [Planctomycetaceae bacterium]
MLSSRKVDYSQLTGVLRATTVMADVRDNPTRPGGGADKHDPRGLRPVPHSGAGAPAALRKDSGPSAPANARAKRTLRRLWRPVTEVDDGAPRLWLTRADQAFVGLLLGVALLLMTLHWLSLSDFGRRQVEVDRLPLAEYQYLIDINRATWVEFAQFEGVGETLARRIVEDREQNGPFASIEALLRVKGIGRKKLDAMRRHLMNGGKSDR